MQKALIVLLSIITIGTMAQEPGTAIDSLKRSYGETKSKVDILNKIKITGLVQAQYQHTDSNGAKNFAGGNFPAQSMNRMMLRRGRIKIAYKGNNSQAVFQFDVSEKGFSLKDAYMTFTDPYFKTMSLQSGLFCRPFGYEVEYSSGLRESPERSRMMQTLFPGERDLGAAIALASEKGLFKYMNFKGGWFVGNGIAAETDNTKDFIGRLSFKLPIDEANGFKIDGGFSTYIGKVSRDYQTKPSETAITTGTVGGTTVIVPKTSTVTQNYTYELDANKTYIRTDSAKYSLAKRQYFGGDIQMYIPYLKELSFLGPTKIMAEYITGIQPGTKTNNSFYQVGNGDLYMRNFSGYYVTFVQDVTKHFQLMVKYDHWDPNTKVSGNEVRTEGDIAYKTLGFGLIYNYDQNIKFTVYYDKVSNETTPNVKDSNGKILYGTNLLDNVLTLRMQYKF